MLLISLSPSLPLSCCPLSIIIVTIILLKHESNHITTLLKILQLLQACPVVYKARYDLGHFLSVLISLCFFPVLCPKPHWPSYWSLTKPGTLPPQFFRPKIFFWKPQDSFPHLLHICGQLSYFSMSSVITISMPPPLALLIFLTQLCFFHTSYHL